jgi:hypothetical protein
MRRVALRWHKSHTAKTGRGRSEAERRYRERKRGQLECQFNLDAYRAVVASCANPHRFDPLRQQQLQHQQDECLAKGGNPRNCRP